MNFFPSQLFNFRSTLLIRFFFLSVAAVLLFGTACNNTIKPVLNEGVIEYEITYPPESSQDKMLAAMMPSKMTLQFKDNMTKADISIGMGIMNASFISRPDKKILTTLLQILDKKYALSMDSSQLKTELIRKGLWKVKFLKDTKRIAGYKCHKAIATDDSKKSVTLYYTEDLKISEPNWSNQFSEVSGVLLQYDLILNNIRMKLTATKINGSTVDPAIFNIPEDYNQVKKEEMPEIFSQFFE